MRAFLLAGIALAALCGTARADRESNITAQQLAQICANRDPKWAEACTAYIDGVSDTITFYQSLVPQDGSGGGRLPSYVCVPGPTTGPQLRQVFLDWSAQNPGAMRSKAIVAVALALRDKFRCPAESRRAP